jgi:hypothetical protein
MADEQGPPLVLLHKKCGHRMHPTLACPDCGEPIEPRDVVPEMGPTLTAVRDT